jgi:20S proteasome subunit beta 7
LGSSGRSDPLFSTHNTNKAFFINNNNNENIMSGNKHTTRPITTGTSVVGLVYDGGVMLAADTLLSYGSMAKSFNTPRIYNIEGRILLGASGEYSDLQEIVAKVKALALEETTNSMESIYVDRKLPAKSLWNYLRAVMYQKRSRMNPYWNDVVVAGWDEQSSKPFLGTVDKLGTTLQENLVATGFGAYLAMPLLRDKWRPDLSEGEARALLEDAMKVLFYRDCRASARIQIAKCTSDGCIVSEPYELDHSNGWNAPSMIRAAGDLDGDGGW